MSLIRVDHVSRYFRVHKREKGIGASLKSIIRRKYDVVKAVDDISFTIDKGELVGYIGPNGAGKSTTIKLLAGILVPTKGTIRVNGRVPHMKRRENSLNIGVIFGQRSQLYWDLPMGETFDLYQKIYKIDKQRFKRNVEFYVELLDMQDFLRTPVRQLSLGQKMRANIAVALLHDPEILYLDEPTIGLDVVAKDTIRNFIMQVNVERQTTVILTTHDMNDIEQICNRIILIDKGKLLYDGTLKSFIKTYSDGYLITIDLLSEELTLPDDRINIIRRKQSEIIVACKNSDISVGEAVTIITRNNVIRDIHIETDNVERIVKKIYITPREG